MKSDESLLEETNGSQTQMSRKAGSKLPSQESCAAMPKHDLASVTADGVEMDLVITEVKCVKCD